MFALFKALYFIGFIILFSLIATLIGLSAYPGYFVVVNTWNSEAILSSLIFSGMAFVITLTVLMFSTAVFIRLVSVIAPIKEGQSSIYGSKMAVWAVQYLLMNFLNTVFLPVFRTTPLMNLFYRFMGARIGNNVFFNSSFIYEPHLLEIGDNSRVGENAIIVPHTTEGKNFTCKKVKIGKNVTIGQYCQIMPGAIIGDNVIIGAGAIVPKDKVIESNSIYGGNPISFIKHYG
ncbi:hypothetical protein HF888_14305 [Bermanella marisrubri]|uniref:Putative glycan acetyltransferase n=1 Tax=Bermanella marisrubri TaxID=207949 RepID=Q1MY51_9GAMM|nr:DapH/DapD/GlmU-related protein [Bermanella marisrubri]EAT10909.1 Putative glycan acetyltransferase [Oceanobacter sp. RED65] [Bermanella marisrubri]QIZ85324.1 hypothetical protein HF888_14305 [Bermanella marisrubri]